VAKATVELQEGLERKSEVDLGNCSNAVRFAVANIAIKGGRFLLETESARGEIDDDKLMEQSSKI
jgi:hypothetical protein